MENKSNIYKEQNRNKVIKEVTEKIKGLRIKLSDDHQKANGKSRIKKDNPYTQKNLSKFISEKTRFMQELEEGKIELDLPVFINLCNALKIDSTDVLEDFIIKDKELNVFKKLNTETQEIIRKYITNVADNSKQENANIKTDFDIGILGNMIKDIRKSKGISSRELSNKIDYSHSYINNIENGVISEIGLPAFINICNALDCSPNDLLQPFLNNNNLEDYNNLNSNHKQFIDSLIRICNEKQQEFGFVTTRKATPEELAKYFKPRN